MKQTKLLGTILAFAFLHTVTAIAQEKGSWRAASSTARSITGDIAFATEKLTINFAIFPISQIRALKPEELKATFDLDGDIAGTGNMYKVNIPAKQKFLRKNSLCGAEDTQWMVTYVVGRDLHLALFSGQKVPAFTPEAIATTTDLCGVYNYVR